MTTKTGSCTHDSAAAGAITAAAAALGTVVPTQQCGANFASCYAPAVATAAVTLLSYATTQTTRCCHCCCRVPLTISLLLLVHDEL
eukprot:3464-Heterococcus_DN1.PRE.2